MRILIALLLSALAASGATTFTEFYVQTTGSNLNGGSSTTDAATYTAVNGNWNGTSIYTPTDGSTPASTVSVGAFASVYIDGASVGVYVARVTAVAAGVNGAITLSTTAASGTAPTTSANTRTIKVGGAWKGPNAAEAFPFNLISAALTDSGGDVPRVNIKSGTTYNVTAAMTHSIAGPIRFQGYTTTVADGGRATIDGGASGTGYVMLTVSGANNDFSDLIFANNGNSGAANLVSATGGECVFRGCVFHDARSAGLNIATAASIAIECEAYNCGKNGSTAGFAAAISGATYLRCISHDNTSTGGIGFSSTSATIITMLNCIAESNAAAGAAIATTSSGYFFGCDFYNNGTAGIDLTGATAASFTIQNCNFVKNGTWGINSSGSSVRNGNIVNCGFGSGTQTNAVGTVTGAGGMIELGSITYTANSTPWVDPANGDFRINLAGAKGAGRGTFTETAASYTGTIGYPDVGSAQHLEAASGGGETSHVFAQ